jgi:hypothetical protein
MELIARWTQRQDSCMELPNSVTRADGTPATIDDYERHQFDTHTLGFDEFGRAEQRIFPLHRRDSVIRPSGYGLDREGARCSYGSSGSTRREREGRVDLIRALHVRDNLPGDDRPRSLMLPRRW